MKSRAVERFPSIMDGSTGLSPLSDLTPFGILTRIFAEVQSLVANADPADIQGPEDLPPLVLEWIEGLPFVGELVGLLEAILGTYDGDDEVLLQIQALFEPIRRALQLLAGFGISDGIPTLADIENFLDFSSSDNFLSPLINGILGGSGNPLSSLITNLLGTASTASTANTNASSALGNWTTLLAGIPGVSNLSGFLSFLTPGTSGAGIFAPLINGVAGGTTNPLSSLISSLTGTASTASTANTNANTANSSISSLLSGMGVGSIASLVSNLLGTSSAASTASSNASSALSQVVSVGTNLFNSWFNPSGGSSGGTPTGNPATDTTTAILAIQAAVAGGFTLQTFTASNPSWSVPTALKNAAEAYAGAFGGGGKGLQGLTGVATQVAGGVPGGYTNNRINPAALGSTLAITVGAAASTNGADGGTTKIMDGATTLVQSVVDQGAMSTVQGYVESNSLPGAGGRGGVGQNSSNVSAGEAGTSTPVATGGAGGTSNTGGGTRVGGAGGNGADGTYTTNPLCGGAGGGGGGGCGASGIGNATGGKGGDGGFPGGASGGGGGAGATTQTGGQPGTPANGLAFILYR